MAKQYTTSYTASGSGSESSSTSSSSSSSSSSFELQPQSSSSSSARSGAKAMLLCYRSATVLRNYATICECNAHCGCPANCAGRLVQWGMQAPLEIYSAGAGKGFGVRCTVALARNTFVCEYAGELFLWKDNDQREEDYESSGHGEYILPFNAVGSSRTRLAIDATRRGNVGRFLNHSCSPNLNTVEVFAEHKGQSRIAFFANTDIPAGTELTWSYGIANATSNKISGKPCHCGAANCKKFLPR